MSGSHVHAGLGAYGPSKAAVIMLVRVLAQELGPTASASTRSRRA